MIINLKTLFFSNIELEGVVVFYINDIQSLVFAGEVQQKEGSQKLNGVYVKSADNYGSCTLNRTRKKLEGN